ncbi:MAG: FAD-dependent oxidoreductase [Caldilineaceae bacterium]
MITQSTDLIETDVLIIGTGVAGCTTALTLADAGVAVTVVTRGRAPQDSNTYWAQGGIIYQGANDSPELLAADVERAGAGHCYPKAVQILAEQGPASVRRVLLERTAVAFDRSQTGDLSLALEGGHTIPRIIHAADATGKAIEIALLNALRAHPNITLLTGHTAIDLLTPSYQGRNRLLVYEPRNCVGAYLLDQERGQVIRCLARKTVLATGGLDKIFLRTTNPAGRAAMAWRWPIGPACTRSTPSLCNSTQPLFMRATVPAFSCRRLCGGPVRGLCTPTANLLWTNTRRSGRFGPA